MAPRHATSMFDDQVSMVRKSKPMPKNVTRSYYSSSEADCRMSQYVEIYLYLLDMQGQNLYHSVFVMLFHCDI